MLVVEDTADHHLQGDSCIIPQALLAEAPLCLLFVFLCLLPAKGSGEPPTYTIQILSVLTALSFVEAIRWGFLEVTNGTSPTALSTSYTFLITLTPSPSSQGVDVSRAEKR